MLYRMSARYTVTRYIYRPVSLPIARRLAATGITPVQVTWVSTAVMFAGAGLFAMGAFAPGAALALLGVVID